MGCGHRLVPVTAAEQDGVDEEREQLVERDSGPPTVGEGSDLVVCGEDRLQMRQPEQREHREVGLPVTAVGRRVDQPHPGRRPQDVAGPQVAVQPGGRLGWARLSGRSARST